MNQKRDYYEVLGVTRDAGSAELKKAYRRLAMKHHPDQNPNDENATDKFREITEAYQILSDDQKRANYDRFGHQAPDLGGFGGATVDMGSMTDFFDSIFGSVFGGGGGRRHRGQAGRDLQYDISLTLEQVVSGADVKVTIPRPVRCDGCGGSGAAKGTRPETCRQCGGRGQIRLQQGIFAMSTTCNVCSGRGEVIRQQCVECAGAGLVSREEEFEVSIPPGVDDGAVKIVEGAGEQGRGGAPDGDLHVLIHVDRHEIFARRGNDLHGEVRISYPQAVLGAELEVPSIDGMVNLKIKAGSQNGAVYRLKGKGVPSLRGGGRGDQHVHVEVDVPRKLNDRQKELIEELGRELGTKVQARQPSIIDKVKSFFD